MESVYSTLFLDVLKSGKFQIGVKNQQPVDADVDMYILHRTRVSAAMVYIHTSA